MSLVDCSLVHCNSDFMVERVADRDRRVGRMQFDIFEESSELRVSSLEIFEEYWEERLELLASSSVIFEESCEFCVARVVMEAAYWDDS